MSNKDYPEEREDWLHIEHFAKLSKKENPHGFVCILCYKTHMPKNCRHTGGKNRNVQLEVKPSYSSGWGKLYEQEEENYGY
jgi:hypothetical protein